MIPLVARTEQADAWMSFDLQLLHGYYTVACELQSTFSGSFVVVFGSNINVKSIKVVMLRIVKLLNEIKMKKA